jgi:hypothetical protein
MNDQQKAQVYDNLIMEHRRLDNQISQIKSEHFELGVKEEKQINELKMKQKFLSDKMQRLFM